MTGILFRNKTELYLHFAFVVEEIDALLSQEFRVTERRNRSFEKTRDVISKKGKNISI